MYKLTEKEESYIDNYWKFINEFINPKINGLNNDWKTYIDSKTQKEKLFSPCEYRKYIIKIISHKYTIDEFYLYEKILNKLLWNLLKHLKILPYEIKHEVKYKKKERSFSHKLHIKNIDKEINFENYLSLNEVDIYTKVFAIMSNRKLYEKIIKNKLNIKDISGLSFYYPCDYPFPNVNFIFYNKNNKKEWIDRIKKLYYNDNSDEEWYSF
jgi:hypothetical protein